LCTTQLCVRIEKRRKEYIWVF